MTPRARSRSRHVDTTSAGRTVITEPAAARRVLRTALRNARDNSGLTQDQVVTALEWSISKLLRIEAGSVGISTTDLRALLALYRIEDERTARHLTAAARASRGSPWWHEFADLLRPQETRRLDYETTATTILEYAQVLVPGPLQTPGYAAAVIAAGTGATTSDPAVGRGVDLRQRWARWRLQRPDVRQTVLLDECALLRPIGGPATMRHQVLALLDMSRRDDVRIAVLPLADSVNVLEGSFALLEDDGERAVYLDGTLSGALVRDDPGAVAHYAQRFERMAASAWTGRQAQQRLAAVADDLNTASPTHR